MTLEESRSLKPGMQLAWADSTGDLVVIRLIVGGDDQGLWLVEGSSGETLLWHSQMHKQWEVV